MTEVRIDEELKNLIEKKQLSKQEKDELIVRICASLCPELSQEFYDLVVRYEKKIKALEQALTTKSKKEQAFDMIKEKGVNVGEFKKDLDWSKFGYDFYLCYFRHFSNEELTKDEFLLVVEVLKDA